MPDPLGPTSPCEPAYSIVILLPGDRGVGAACLAGWHGQHYPREHYEILGISDGSEPAADSRLLASPNPPDQILREMGAHRSKLYDLGARAARGRFVVLTESHCLPEPDFLIELDRYLRDTSYAGACCRSEPICPDNLARMDHRLFEEGFREFRKEGDWRKINVHGVAIRRDVYLEVGGLDHHYGLFAEMLLAARLRDRGARLGYAERAVVHHNYRTGLREVIDFLGDGVTGECTYRRDHPGPDTVGYTFLPPPRPQDGKGDLLGFLLRALGAEAVGRALWQGNRTTLGAFARALLWTLRSGWRGRWLAKAHLAKSALGCLVWRWHGPRLERCYRELCEAASRCAYLDWLASQPSQVRTHGVSQPTWQIRDIPDQDLLGFHALESWQGKAFRWTGAAAVLRLPLAPGENEIVLDTGGLRPDLALCHLSAYSNGRRLPASAIAFSPDSVRLLLPAAWHSSGSPLCLILTCGPIQPWKHGVADRRELGVPIFAVHCRAAANSVAA